MEYKNKSIPGVNKGISFVKYLHKIPALKLSDSGSYECEVEQEINGRKISNNKKINIEICMSLLYTYPLLFLHLSLLYQEKDSQSKQPT